MQGTAARWRRRHPSDRRVDRGGLGQADNRAAEHRRKLSRWNQWDRGLDVVVEGDGAQADDEDTLKCLAYAWRTSGKGASTRHVPGRSTMKRRRHGVLGGTHEGPPFGKPIFTHTRSALVFLAMSLGNGCSL
jgi:hypothetical protein